MRIVALITFGLFLYCDFAGANLHTAVSLNFLGRVREYLEDGRTNINEFAYYNSQESGATPLWIAAVNGYEDVAKELIARGADLNLRSYHLGTTPLIEACWRGHQDMAILLIKSGADVNAIDKANETALMGCALNQFHVAVKMLVERGADANVRNRVGGVNALMYSTKKMKDAEIFTLLLPLTSSVLVKDNFGNTIRDWLQDEQLLELITARERIESIPLDFEDLKHYLTPSELSKFLNDLLAQAENG